MTADLLTTLGSTGGLINSAFPCSIGPSSSLDSNTTSTITIEGYNTFFLDVAINRGFTGTIMIQAPFVINSSPGNKVPLILTNFQFDQYIQRIGVYPLTYQLFIFDLLASVVPYTNTQSQVLLSNPYLEFGNIYFGGMVISSIETSFNIQINVLGRPPCFRSGLSSTLPDCTPGIVLYTSLDPCQIEELSPKLALTNLQTFEGSVFNQSQLKITSYQKGFPTGAKSAIILRNKYLPLSGTYSVGFILGCQVYNAGTVTLSTISLS